MASDQSLILILGDQLSRGLPSLRRADRSRDVVLMAEVMEEASYVRHHRKKIVLVFSAMRHFAQSLRQEGWTVDYVTIDDPGNTQSLVGELARAKARHGIAEEVMTEPGEWRLAQALAHVPMLEDTRFICSRAEFTAFAEGRRSLRMEHFYRQMRRKTGLLMAGDEPEGGRWNFDAENRKPTRAGLFMPEPLRFEPDGITRECMEIAATLSPSGFGDIDPFWFAVTEADAHRALDHFLVHALPRFGETQDAMLASSDFLHHAVLSPYINLGLLDPLDVCRRAEHEWKTGKAPLASVEGFIRQIIGWREYVRGIYWRGMPDYARANALEAKRPLPAFYWTGETEMNCVQSVVAATRHNAYAHHIQRLMVTGNFALLAGIDPVRVHEWYLAVYADAYEWVEMPNTIGMALYADGGLMASKPYAASGAYINRMSDYCGSCRYDVKKRLGDDACPFNALYWNFIATHKARFSRNPRMAQIVRGYERFDEQEQKAIADRAEMFLEDIEPWDEGK